MKPANEITKSILHLQQSIAAHLPALREDVNGVISRKEKDSNQIEYLLDTLLSLTTAGMGEDLFIRLLEYCKTVNPEAAADYWRFFEEMNE